MSQETEKHTTSIPTDSMFRLIDPYTLSEKTSPISQALNEQLERGDTLICINGESIGKIIRETLDLHQEKGEDNSTFKSRVNK